MAFADPASWTSTATFSYCTAPFYWEGKAKIDEDVSKIFERKMKSKLSDLRKTRVVTYAQVCGKVNNPQKHQCHSWEGLQNMSLPFMAGEVWNFDKLFFKAKVPLIY